MAVNILASQGSLEKSLLFHRAMKIRFHLSPNLTSPSASSLRRTIGWTERQVPLAVKMGAPLVTITALTTTLLSLNTLATLRQRLKDSYTAQTYQLATVVQAEFESRPSDAAAMNDFLQGLKKAEPLVNHIRVYRLIHGQPALWATTDPDDFNGSYQLEEEDTDPLLKGTQSEKEDTQKEQLEIDLPLRSRGQITAAIGVYSTLRPRNQAIAASTRSTLMGTGISVGGQIVALLLVLYWAVLSRITRLSRAAARVAKGDLTVHLPEGDYPRGRDEVINVAREFDRMMQAVRSRSDELLSKNQQLEVTHARLEQLNQDLTERTQALNQSLSELQHTQAQLIQTEKMSSLGQLVAGIAHEINTPLGAIQASSGNMTKALEETLAQLPQLVQRLTLQQQADFFALLNQALQSKAPVTSSEKRPLRRVLTQQLEACGLENARQLSDRLVDLGIWSGIEPFVSLLRSSEGQWVLQLIYNLSRIQGNNRTIQTAVGRASKIVFVLKSYARFDQSGEKQPVPIVEGLETVLELYHSQLKHGIEVERRYDTIPKLWGDPDELIQVWTNLIHNAIQAMDGKGILEIVAAAQDDQVIVQIIDSGSGISLEHQTKIFYPFFTTKPRGEGSGLGLSISQTIIEKHMGQIECHSQPGRTTFTVRLPLKQEQSAATVSDAPLKASILVNN